MADLLFDWGTMNVRGETDIVVHAQTPDGLRAAVHVDALALTDLPPGGRDDTPWEQAKHHSKLIERIANVKWHAIDFSTIADPRSAPPHRIGIGLNDLSGPLLESDAPARMGTTAMIEARIAEEVRRLRRDSGDEGPAPRMPAVSPVEWPGRRLNWEVRHADGRHYDTIATAVVLVQREGWLLTSG